MLLLSEANSKKREQTWINDDQEWSSKRVAQVCRRRRDVEVVLNVPG
jgi:hypothetical protein